MTRYSVSPSRLTSYSAQMCGCEIWEIVLASRSKRWRSSGLAERCGGNTLTATVRSRRASRALYTSPIPPAPMGSRIS